MHKTIPLNLPHAPDGQLYVEEGGRRVLRVFPDLRSDQTAEIAALRAALAKHVGPRGDYDGFIIDLADAKNVPRS
jgi:hypothetical protein